MHTFDPNIKFTTKFMINEEKPFLDTKIYLKNNTLVMKMYRKESVSEVITNSRESITLKKYLISTLYVEIYRCNNTTSNDGDLKIALNNLTDLAVKNGYRLSLIKEKIKEVKNQKFISKEGKTERIAKISKYPERNYNLVLTYTNDRCTKISSKIYNLIKNITPNFNLSIISSNDKIPRLHSPRF